MPERAYVLLFSKRFWQHLTNFCIEKVIASMSKWRAARVVLLGDTGVGKTSIYDRLCNNEFNPDQTATVQANLRQREYEISGERLYMTIFDTAGQEQYKCVTRWYVTNVDFALLVFDITNPRSLADLDNWRTLAIEQSPNCRTIIVANKIDLSMQRAVEPADGWKYAESYNSAFFEVSAKTGCGLAELSEYVEERFFELVQDGSLKGDPKTIDLVAPETKHRQCKC